ncbi:MAG: hypothetical protein ACFE68_09435 [Candidatus Hodarchaeota archaeon]
MGVKYARPLGVSIIAILGFIVALFLLLAGYLMVDDPSGVAAEIDDPDISADDVETAGYVTLVIGFFALLMAIGFWLTQTWAWILGILITLAVIGLAAYTLYTVGLEEETYGDAAAVFIGFIILGYLLFDKDVKAAFTD